VEVCDGVDNDCDGTVDDDAIDAVPVYADADADGYGDEVDAYGCEGSGVTTGGDCDDADATVFPGAEEQCDGVDQDCDGTVDEDAADAGTWYADADGDGYGDATATTDACDAPDGYVADGTDCDDTRVEINPSMSEICNDVDDDCSGVVDDSSVDAGTWYVDADGDGYGDPTASFIACDAPAGYVADGTDCDDTDATYNPGAEEADCTDPNDYNCDGSVGYADLDGDGAVACEDCDDTDAGAYPGGSEVCDGADNDCDGTEDGPDAADALTWYADTDGDTFGDPSNTTLDCVAPSGYVTDARDCDDTDDAVSPVAIEACNGYDDDCDGEIDEEAVDSVEWYADADGDGFGDAATVADACDAPDGYVSDYADCDDADASVNPSAIESCNGVDDNCDGLTDQADSVDANVYYADSDGDGYGVSTGRAEACEAPAGYVDNDGDCNDADASVSPAAVETCDSLDNDCDGSMDEDASDGTTYYADTDADGYGDAATPEIACVLPTGYTADATDCDDTSSAVHPGATEYCNGTDDDCDGTIDPDTSADAATWYADADGDGFGDPSPGALGCSAPDGYVSSATDCDDGDGAIYPGADEYCNGEDDDCDGTIDESGALDVTAVYADTDGDGYGDPSALTRACATAAGYTTDATDCDDTDSTVFPGADEYCDGVDHDCDGTSDEASSVDATTWYLDSDSDGYGDGTASTEACDLPPGYAAAATDCDDAHASVNPGATEECSTSADDDCDGSVNEADARGCTSYYGDLDGDGSAADTVSACLCSATTGYSTTAGDDCDDTDASVYLGATDTCGDGVDGDCDGYDAACPMSGDYDLSGASAELEGEATSDAFGSSLANLADIDGDGIPDALLAAPGYAGAAGRVYVVLGPDLWTSGTVDAVSTFTGVSSGDAMSQAAAGDFDADGETDLVLGAAAADTSGADAGVAYIFKGPVASGDFDVGLDADVALVGDSASDELGAGVTWLEDQNGDGRDELVLGAPGDARGGAGAGSIFWFSGSAVVTGVSATSMATSGADGIVMGTHDGDAFGSAVLDAGDMDGDGTSDLVVGAPQFDSTVTDGGAIFLWNSPPTGTQAASTADAFWTGEAAGDFAGGALAAAGDADGDGYGDVLVGAAGRDAGAADGGAVYLVPWGSGASDLADATAVFEGDSADLGLATSAASDLDGDGYPDVVVGASTADDNGTDAGAAWLFYGPVAGTYLLSAADVRFLGEVAGDEAGASILGGADWDVDGYDDVLLGATGRDGGGSGSGSVYVVAGGE
jgi:hypothetical protein